MQTCLLSRTKMQPASRHKIPRTRRIIRRQHPLRLRSKRLTNAI